MNMILMVFSVSAWHDYMGEYVRVDVELITPNGIIGLDDNVAVSYDKLTNQITLEDNINIETFRLKEELLTQILNSVREHYSSVHTY